MQCAFLFCFLPLASCAQNTYKDSGETHFTEILNDPCFASAVVSVVLYDLDADSVIVNHQGNLALPPASILKVWTTAAALSTLRPEFRFKTDIGYQGDVLADAMEGDLMITGFGDPTLGSYHFHDDGFDNIFIKIFEELRVRDIKHITGDIVGQGGYYSHDRIPAGWPYQDLGNYYGAFCSGLNIADNLFYLKLKQKMMPGAAIEEWTVYPIVPDLVLDSYLTSGEKGSGDNAYIMGGPFQTHRYLQGTIPPGNAHFTIKGSVPDPALFFSINLKLFLESKGISIDGAAKSTYSKPSKSNLFFTMDSPDLLNIVKKTNEKSINLFAEGLGMYLARDEQNNKSSWLINFWKNKGIDVDGCRLSDFSGLSPDNAISGVSMIDVLKYIYHNDSLKDMITASLPVAGRTGTLRSFLDKSPAEGKVMAKSGLISGVRNYAGYIEKNDRTYAFCAMTQNPTCKSYTVRTKLESLVESLYHLIR